MQLFSCVVFFFFKQKTAYEMRISDWSSDVCSSDLDFAQMPSTLPVADGRGALLRSEGREGRPAGHDAQARAQAAERQLAIVEDDRAEIGRATCRERVCQYV